MMVRFLITFSIRFPWVVVGCAVALLVVGVLRLKQASWDVFPEFSPPQIVIQTEAPGLAAEEVEQFVTLPLESAISGVSRLKTLRSSSVPGLCVITAIFEDSTDILAARQLVSERLVEVQSQLPKTVQQPKMTPITGSTSRLLMLGLTSNKETSAQDLRTLADWNLRRRLQAVPGVAHVEVFGGDVKQYQIQIDPVRLQAYHLTLDEVVLAARAATGLGGAGFVETENQRLPIRQKMRVEHEADLASVPVAFRDGISLPLEDVAEIQCRAADAYGGAKINGQSGVLLVVHKQPNASTLEVTAALQNLLRDMKFSLPKDVTLHSELFEQATFIKRALSNLGQSLVIGCLLVTVVLVLFLMNARVLAISLVAIPLSLLGAVIVLLQAGASMNAMTLGGMAIALGELVDDAIVDVENVLRRLAENRKLDQPKPFRDVVLESSLEIRNAIVYASLIVMIVFLPVFFLDGLAGKIFGPLGMAYIASIGVSLIVALTVTPALGVLMLQRENKRDAITPWLVRICNSLYRNLLQYGLVRPWLVIFSSVVLTLAGLGILPFLGGEFLPDFRESNFVIFMAGKPDSSLAESERSGAILAKELLGINGVKSVAQQIGRANLSEDTWGPNISEVWVSLDDSADYETVLAQVREVLDRTPGYAFQVKQFLRERIDEVLTGSTADLLVRVVGPELDVLRLKAQEVALTMREIKGVEDLRIEPMVVVPQLEISLIPEKTANYGLAVGTTSQAIQVLLGGVQVGQVYEADRTFDVVVRASPRFRDDPRKLGDILLDSPYGHPVPLRSFAEIDVVSAPNMINREQGSRRTLVTCNAEGRDVESVMVDIQKSLSKNVALPEGYHFEFAGEYAAKVESQRRLILLSMVSLVGILLLLYVVFRSFPLSLMVMLSIPMAGIGGVASVFVTGSDISLGSLVGFITVFGIAVRNGILLVGNFQRLPINNLDDRLLIGAAVERLAPILMTACTTVLAIVPLIVTGNLPGHEIEYPMAIVIMGGLVSSTILTLFVLPVIYKVVVIRWKWNAT